MRRLNRKRRVARREPARNSTRHSPSRVCRDAIVQWVASIALMFSAGMNDARSRRDAGAEVTLRSPEKRRSP